MENDGLCVLRAPVLVEDFDAIVRGYAGHRLTPSGPSLTCRASCVIEHSPLRMTPGFFLSSIPTPAGVASVFREHRFVLVPRTPYHIGERQRRYPSGKNRIPARLKSAMQQPSGASRGAKTDLAKLLRPHSGIGPE